MHNPSSNPNSPATRREFLKKTAIASAAVAAVPLLRPTVYGQAPSANVTGANSKINVGYIGVMGSRKTHAKRLERLAEVGISKPQDLARLMSPIGLDLGARTPEETAISMFTRSRTQARLYHKN